MNAWLSGLPDGSERNACPAEALDAGVTVLERRAAAGKLTRSDWLYALRPLGLAANVPASVKAHAFAFAKRLADDPKTPEDMRPHALYAMATLDPEAVRKLPDLPAWIASRMAERDAILRSTCD
jgi:hypothetical protein